MRKEKVPGTFRWLTVGAVAGLAALWLFTLQNDLGDLTGDSAKYVALARALLDGRGYHAIFLPGSPPFREAPWLFPLLLMPVVDVFGLSAWWLHLWMVILSTVAFVLLWRCLRLRADETTAFLALLLTGTSVIWWDGVSRIMSDVPFVGAVALGCWCVDRYRRASTVTRGVWWMTLASLVAAIYLRTVGVVLGVAAALSLCWDGWSQRRSASWWRATFGLLILWGIAAGAWAWYLCGGGLAGLTHLRLADPLGAYAAPATIASLFARALLNLRYYAAETALVLCPVHERISAWPEVTAWCFLGIAAVGGWRRWRQQRAVEWLFVVLYCASLLLWSYRDTRLLLPLVPWLWLSFLSGWQVLTRSEEGTVSSPRRSYMMIVTVLAFMQSFTLGAQVRRTISRTALGQRQLQFIEANRWFAAHARPSSIILSSKPSVTWWYSRRLAVDYPPLAPEDGPDVVRQRLLACGAEFLLLDAFSPSVNQVVVPALARHPEDVRLAAIFGETLILQWRDSAQKTLP